MKNIFLSVIIPCYNEEANLKAGVLKQVADFLTKKNFAWEVIVSDDGSSDRSRDLVAKFIKTNPNFYLLINHHGGKALALRAGIKAAKGEIILLTDMDQSTPIKEMEKLLPWFETGYQVVIGSRGIKRTGFPWFRQLMSLVFRILRGFFLLPKIVDTQCGFKAFRSKVIKEIFPQLEIFLSKEPVRGWRVSAFDVELLFLLQKSGYQIKEVEVDWQDRDVSETKKPHFLNESKNMATEIIRVKLNDWQGKYG